MRIRVGLPHYCSRFNNEAVVRIATRSRETGRTGFSRADRAEMQDRPAPVATHVSLQIRGGVVISGLREISGAIDTGFVPIPGEQESEM